MDRDGAVIVRTVELGPPAGNSADHRGPGRAGPWLACGRIGGGDGLGRRLPCRGAADHRGRGDRVGGDGRCRDRDPAGAGLAHLLAHAGRCRHPAERSTGRGSENLAQADDRLAGAAPRYSLQGFETAGYRGPCRAADCADLGAPRRSRCVCTPRSTMPPAPRSASPIRPSLDSGAAGRRGGAGAAGGADRGGRAPGSRRASPPPGSSCCRRRRRQRQGHRRSWFGCAARAPLFKRPICLSKA